MLDEPSLISSVVNVTTPVLVLTLATNAFVERTPVVLSYANAEPETEIAALALLSR